MKPSKVFKRLVDNGQYAQTRWMCIALFDAFAVKPWYWYSWFKASKEIKAFLKFLASAHYGRPAETLVSGLNEYFRHECKIDLPYLHVDRKFVNAVCTDIYSDWDNRFAIIAAAGDALIQRCQADCKK